LHLLALLLRLHRGGGEETEQEHGEKTGKEKRPGSRCTRAQSEVGTCRGIGWMRGRAQRRQKSAHGIRRLVVEQGYMRTSGGGGAEAAHKEKGAPLQRDPVTGKEPVVGRPLAATGSGGREYTWRGGFATG
jgi:hypothetical protein